MKYEICVGIYSGDITWVNGPFPCSVHNIEMFRSSLMSHLDRLERVEADDGYIGEAPLKVKCPKSSVNPEETLAMQAKVRMRHETVNKRFKQWAILKQVFRHPLVKHGSVFRAIAVMTQLAIEDGEKLFDVEYTNKG